jgi:predicted aspartyl protease
VVALIDTGAGHSAIFRHAAERVGVHMEAGTALERHSARGIGPQIVRSVRMDLGTVDVGDLEFTHMPVDVLDDRGGDEVEMLLGAEFQRRVHLWISYSSHTLIMQYPPTASKKPQ